MLYSAADLGLNDGDRIGAIVFKGLQLRKYL